MVQALANQVSGHARPYILVSAIDRNYTVPYCAMLSSFRDHNPGAPITAFAIHYDLKRHDQRFLNAVCQRAGIDLRLVAIPRHPFCSFVTRRRRFLGDRTTLSPIAYAKGFIDRFLPPDIDRVICMDGDIIVNGDMSELRDMELNAPLMAVPNIPRSRPDHFNSGLMLVDLAAWRRWRIADIVERFLTDFSDALASHDQHMLNLLFKDRWSRLDLKWNYIEDHYRSMAGHPRFTEAEILAARAAPVVIHYAVGSDKPWYRHCEHPRADLYRHYRAGLEPLMAGLHIININDGLGED